MDVVLGIGRHVEVHDVGHLGDVDATREHVGGHKHVGLAGREAPQCRLALVLRAVAVDGGCADARLGELAAHHVGAVLAAAEDDDALGALLLEHIGEDAHLLALGHAQHILVDSLRGGALVGDLHAGGVVDEGLHVGEHVVVERGREEQGLAAGRRLGHDATHGGREAHVEHAVGLVEHERLDMGEVRRALLDEVDEAAGRGDEQVAATGEGRLLGLVAHAAHHDRAGVAGVGADGTGARLDLLGELAGGGHHEHEDALAAPGMAEPVERGKQEGRGLARARLRRRHDVAALKDRGDGAGLHGRGAVVPHVGHGGEHLLGQAELVEGNYLIVHI